ncbi:MAG: hypothetical protein WCH11_01280, partial [Bdellovibrio sp.]
EMGSKSVVMAYMADKLGEQAQGVSVAADGYEFIFRDTDFFVAGTAVPRPEFVQMMDRIKSVTMGLEDATVNIQSMLFNQSVAGSDPRLADEVVRKRLSILQNRVQSFLDAPTTDVTGVPLLQSSKNWIEGQGTRPNGIIKFTIRQKETRSDGTKYRKLDKIFDRERSLDMKEYRDYLERSTR